MIKENISQLLRKVEGSSVVEMALIMPVLLLLFIGTVDFARAYYVAIELSAAAHAGALYGSQNPTDIPGMTAVAKLNATDVPTLNPIATYGSNCFDGSAPTSKGCPSTGNMVYWIKVTATATYTPILSYSTLPFSIPTSISLSSQAIMNAAY